MQGIFQAELSKLSNLQWLTLHSNNLSGKTNTVIVDITAGKIPHELYLLNLDNYLTGNGLYFTYLIMNANSTFQKEKCH